MPIRRILTYPHPILRAEAPEWNFNTEQPLLQQKLESIAQDMLETLEKVERGAALAAPQIGESIRLICFDVKKASESGVSMPLFAVNPKILDNMREMSASLEGCLSFPGIFEKVPRSTGVKVEWFDLFGERHEGAFEGFWARCWQHEIDHLNGHLYIDRMNRKDQYRVKGVMLARAS